MRIMGKEIYKGPTEICLISPDLESAGRSVMSGTAEQQKIKLPFYLTGLPLQIWNRHLIPLAGLLLAPHQRIDPVHCRIHHWWQSR